jgi:3-oxoacyl-(acyl-carrier-protein) synthase
VDHISVSADFSGEAERLERSAVERVFGERSAVLGVTPLEYLSGDFGGAGALRAAAVLLGIRTGVPLPAVRPDRLSGGYVYPDSWGVRGPGAMRNGVLISAAFGGGCACLVFSGPDPQEGGAL